MTSSPQQNLPRSIPQLLFNASKQHAGRTAIEEHGECIDYSDLPRLALAVTRSLMAQGIGKGDVVSTSISRVSGNVIFVKDNETIGKGTCSVTTNKKF